MAPDPTGSQSTPRIVSFEGIDGAGKSTLLTRLKQALGEAGVGALFTREETDTFLGDTVRRAVSEGNDPLAVLYLFLADRIQHLSDLKQPLEAGQLVITDRYHDSTRAYQSIALSDRFDDPATFDAWLDKVSREWLVVPARTYLLDIDPETSLARLDGRSERGGYEKRRFLEQVRKRYLEIAKNEPDRWLVLDARKDPHELVQRVMDDLRELGFVPGAPEKKTGRS